MNAWDDARRHIDEMQGMVHDIQRDITAIQRHLRWMVVLVIVLGLLLAVAAIATAPLW